jgi:hypothetical protein
MSLADSRRVFPSYVLLFQDASNSIKYVQTHRDAASGKDAQVQCGF